MRKQGQQEGMNAEKYSFPVPVLRWHCSPYTHRSLNMRGLICWESSRETKNILANDSKDAAELSWQNDLQDENDAFHLGSPLQVFAGARSHGKFALNGAILGRSLSVALCRPLGNINPQSQDNGHTPLLSTLLLFPHVLFSSMYVGFCWANDGKKCPLKNKQMQMLKL